MLRSDISDWVVHFVHRRNPDNLIYDNGGEIISLPIAYAKGKAIFAGDWDYDDKDYGIEDDAYAFAVLLKILDDGHIRANWSYRNGKPTIYGPRAAVCFTEMPLYALMDYAQWRDNEYAVDFYGVAVLRDELFRFGGRPAIYGLSSSHKEATEGDPYYRYGGRTLAYECGIAPHEQYRYVSTRLGCSSRIDWTHEREWRWTKDFKNDLFDIPGLPLWLADGGVQFSSILIIVSNSEEVSMFLDKMKEYHDSGSNNYDLQFNRDILRNTRVISLEEISDACRKRQIFE